MSEPLYTYVRGTGWVPYNDCLLLTQTYDGVPVRVVERNPQGNERWFRISRNGPWTTKGQPDIPTIKNYINEERLEDLAKWGDRSNREIMRDYHYFVVERV